MNIKQLFIGFILLVSINIFSLKFIDNRIFQYLEIINLIFLFAAVVSKKIKINGFFKYELFYIALLTILASFPAAIFHGQDFSLSIFVSRVVLYLLLYRFLHIYKVDVSGLKKIIIVFGIIWAAIVIIQNFTFPVILFQKHDRDIEMIQKLARGSIMRVAIEDPRLGVLAFFILFFDGIKNMFSLKKVLILTILFLAIFLTGTRQLIFTVLFLLIIWFVFSKPKNLSKRIFQFCILFPIIFIFTIKSYDLYAGLIDTTLRDLDMDYIRIREAEFYLLDYWPKNHLGFAYIFGNGWEHGQSSYGREIIEKHWGQLRFYREDIGILGAVNKFGILYFIVVTLLFKKVLSFGFNEDTIFVKYFFLFLGLTYFTGRNFFESGLVIMLICICLYILDEEKINNFYSNSGSQPG